MADLNKWCFTGRLGADAAVKQTNNGKTVLEMSVAINSGFGAYAKTLWVKAKMWGERGNNIAPILKKGSLIAISGEPDLDEWTDKEGQHHAALAIRVGDVQLLHSKKEGESEQQPEPEQGSEETVF